MHHRDDQAALGRLRRWTRSAPCPICGGYDGLARGAGVRCHGFLSSDGDYAHCSREDHAGGLPAENSSQTYAHRIGASCKCGTDHGTPTALPPMPSERKIIITPAPWDEPYWRSRCGKPTGRWTYENGLCVVRFVSPDGTKTYRQFHSREGGWAAGAPDALPCLYRRTDLTNAPTDAVFYVVEGEKCADALVAAGLQATTNPGGAGKFRLLPASELEIFTGRCVVVCADNDEPGKAHAAQVARSLAEFASEIRVVHFPELPEGGDVADWLAGGQTTTDLAARIESVSLVGSIAAPPTDAPPHTDADAPPPPSSGNRKLSSNSYLTVYQILRGDLRGVLEGKSLTHNLMTGEDMLGDAPVTDVDVSVVRARIERSFSGGIDKNGDEKGMKQSVADIHAGISHVAIERATHPVRDFLLGLRWDGVPRLAKFADLLGATTDLSRAIMRRWVISLVARPLDPGCKVDTMLILVGDQGAGKSTFMEVMGSPWFSDSPIDIKHKDGFENMRRHWITEFAELESLLRARDMEQVKSFLSSRQDTYRQSYGRRPITVKRSGVVVGSTNREQFLTDETGNRRFWPVRCGEIQIESVRKQRDQILAEAVTLYKQGIEWWLDLDESRDLGEYQKEFEQRDESWGPAVQDWLKRRTVRTPFSAETVLTEAIKKPLGQCTKGDEMRVAKILRGLECVRKHTRTGNLWKNKDWPDVNAGEDLDS